MKNYQKVTLLLSCISLLISITFIMQAYAKYSTAIDGDAQISIAKWNVIVNDINVKTGASLSGHIIPEFPRE